MGCNRRSEAIFSKCQKKSDILKAGTGDINELNNLINQFVFHHFFMNVEIVILKIIFS